MNDATTPTVLSGGNWSAVLSNNVTYYVSGNVSASGKVILQSIGTLTVSSGAVVSGATISGSTYPTVSVLNGGVVQNSLIWDGYVSAFDGAKLSNNVLNSNWVVLNSGASSINDTYINSGNVQPGAGITVANGASLVSPYIGDASAGSFVAVVSSGATVSDPTVAPNGGQLVISSGKLASNEPAPCFLAGTLIEMEGSAKPVEDIRIGDHVMTYQNDVCEQREVIWAGRRKITIDASKPDDLADYPVRVVRNALGEGRPFKDLLITAEHCLFLDGAFVPVRMLVNGQSIYYDTKITQYECFHIETEKHAILMSDGILSESYLDTGGRQRFRQTGKILALGGRTLSWQDSAAAPLVTTRDFVEPLYERFTQRAEMLAIGLKRQQSPIVTYNPELYIVTDAGQRLAPLRNKSKQYLFALPLDTREVRIVSNRSRPCDAVGPYVDDRRMLGVLISGIEIYDSRGKLNLSEILTSQDVDGWHSIETYGRRWTDGNARLILPRLRSNNATLLAIQVDAAGPYVSRMEEVNQWSHVAGSKNF
ncbi:Hint domain-containing protein [Asaia sp. HN010]|uniref:Hint domain-containing protein n=1 Tax=Asaia sp. HN010 TaxID=3081233 RepID=UPI003017BD92